MTKARWRAGLASALVAASVLLASCVEAGCPSVVADLNDPGLRERIGSDYVAGTAIVQRYVPSPNEAARGYDVAITSRIAGLAREEQIMFVVAADRMSTIQLGAEVLVVGRRVDVAGIESVAGCPALVPLER